MAKEIVVVASEILYENVSSTVVLRFEFLGGNTSILRWN